MHENENENENKDKNDIDIDIDIDSNDNIENPDQMDLVSEGLSNEFYLKQEIKHKLDDLNMFFRSGRKDRAIEMIDQLMEQRDNISDNDLKLRIVLTSAWFLKSKEDITSIDKCDEIIERYNLALECLNLSSGYSKKKHILEVLDGKLYGDAMRYSFIFEEDHYIHEAKSITSNLQTIIDIKNQLSSQIGLITSLLKNKESFSNKAISDNFYYTSWFSEYLCAVLTALYAKSITDDIGKAQETLITNGKKYDRPELQEISAQLFKQSLRMIYQWLNIKKSEIDKGFFTVRGLFLALLLYKKLNEENIIDSSFSIDLKKPDVKIDDFISETKEKLAKFSDDGRALPMFRNSSLFTEKKMLEGVTDVIKQSGLIPFSLLE